MVAPPARMLPGRATHQAMAQVVSPQDHLTCTGPGLPPTKGADEDRRMLIQRSAHIRQPFGAEDGAP